ncbi:hypothetical protein SISSUDRAFT_712953 [Sistotremastrum suecicum HHB10207 ss-3]|uniref:DUF6535 domain-containing protein n=1 Tax=Sistotremastrum suecicum HHB10207 ss-3 TaxID=1314776 RepID=A0A166DSZ7_9AGAM|nr:hypothetical protein SISSUDRAFT_712953 [Sistotremastrum suecicum HHB10207 ss-3]
MTWKVLGQEAVAKTKEKVDQWKDLMDVSLIFVSCIHGQFGNQLTMLIAIKIAIFLTVVTAFIAPVIQAFTSTPVDPSTDSLSTSNKPPLPPVSLQLVAFFYYLALIVSILNSVLCVLGKQWAARVVSLPPGKTELQRTLAHEQRKALAEGKLIPLMGVLFWTLLLSITFFIIGLLIQLWALAFSCTKPAFILVVAAALGSGLSVLILGIILATTYHASVNDNSPFESPLSSAMRPALKWLNARAEEKPADAEVATPSDNSEDDESDLEDASRDDTFEKNARIEDLMKIRETDSENVKVVKTFAHLVINTNDPEVLERAAPSFQFNQWHDIWDELRPVFLAVRGRFLTTDTSIRVKETVHKQLVYFKGWTGWTSDWHTWRSDLEESEMTRWCREECRRLVDRSPDSRQEYFSSWLFFVSFQKDNTDLRFRPDATDSYEKCVCRPKGP